MKALTTRPSAWKRIPAVQSSNLERGSLKEYSVFACYPEDCSGRVVLRTDASWSLGVFVL